MSPRQTIINRFIFFMSLVGICMAAYVLQGFLRSAPILCPNSGCELVRKNPASYLMGIPIPGYGFAGYGILAISAFLRTTNPSRVLSRIMMGTALFGMVFVLWFTYVELYVIKGICTWCAVSTVNMLIIGGLTMYSGIFLKKGRNTV